MNVSVRLGGLAGSWRVDGARSVQAWLAGVPWEQAAPLVVHAAPALRTELRDDVQGALLLQGMTTVDVDEAWLQQNTPTAQSLTDWMGVPDSTFITACRGLVSMSTVDPLVLVVHVPDGDGDTARWIDSLRQVADASLKLGGRVALCVVTSGSAVPVHAVRFDRAWPVENRGGGDPWAAYVHERVAWHVWGGLVGARSVEQFMPAAAPVGHDQRIEDALDQHARASLKALPEPLVKRLEGDLRTLRGLPELVRSHGVRSGMAHAARPVPWLARALLLTTPRHPQRRELAAAVVCRPLAMRLLAQCMDVEARIRDASLTSPPQRPPQGESERVHLRRMEDPNSIEHTLPPRGRVPYATEWDVASLHAVIQVAHVKREKRNAFHDLRRVRNHLAHGGAVGWKAVEVVRRLVSRCA